MYMLKLVLLNTNDSKLQPRDSQKNSRDDVQSDCSEMVGFVSVPHCVVLR